MLGARNYPERALVTGFFIICDLEHTMLLSEIIEDVIDTLGRPDLQKFVSVRVRQQLKTLHSMDNWPLDLVEHLVTIQNPGSLVRMTLPPRCRKIFQIIPTTPDGQRMQLPTDELEVIGYQEIDPRKVIGYHNQMASDYYYLAGDALNIRTSTQPTKLLFSYYAYPDLTSDNAVTWLTEFWPELVTYRCLYICYKMLGNLEQANNIEIMYRESLEVMKASALTAGV